MRMLLYNPAALLSPVSSSKHKVRQNLQYFGSRRPSLSSNSFQDFSALALKVMVEGVEASSTGKFDALGLDAETPTPDSRLLLEPNVTVDPLIDGVTLPFPSSAKDSMVGTSLLYRPHSGVVVESKIESQSTQPSPKSAISRQSCFPDVQTTEEGLAALVREIEVLALGEPLIESGTPRGSA